MCYTGCNPAIKENLHPVAFFVQAPCGIVPPMERKRSNWVAHWRRFKGLTQAQLVERLTEYAAKNPSEDIPATTASLSRIENGEQNFRMSFLEAVSEILSADGDLVRPGDLLDRNPFKGMAKVISLIDRMDEEQQRRAAEVLNAVFGDQPDKRSA
jgi:transcriptional regulator with XRE-family HTH domain